jgi:putative phosphoesterase
MKIGILSDTHSREQNTKIALDTFRERGVTKLIHCGDITSAPTILLFAGWDISFARGNVDLDTDELITATRMIGVSIPKFVQEIEVEGKTIAALHGNDHGAMFRLMISGKYAYICHGHTHRRHNEYRDAYAVRIINPGAMGGSQRETRSICILDTTDDSVEFIEFPDLF